jgi:hypothetical protein
MLNLSDIHKISNRRHVCDCSRTKNISYVTRGLSICMIYLYATFQMQLNSYRWQTGKWSTGRHVVFYILQNAPKQKHIFWRSITTPHLWMLY